MMTSRGCAHSIAELLGTSGGETPQLTEQHLKLIRGESPEADYEFTPESVAGECSLVVGGSKVPVECNRDHAGSPGSHLGEAPLPGRLGLSLARKPAPRSVRFRVRDVRGQ